MDDAKYQNGVWFVYDGECPMCTMASHALRIKKQYGELHLINARDYDGEPLVAEITARGIDLDEGMVIYEGGRFYHGKDALSFMAQYGEGSNLFTAASKGFLWSETLNAIIYPWMRGTRNWLLYRKNVPRIDNLNLKNEPTFKSIFGASWDDLPPVMKKHYTNRPYTDDLSICEGTLDVMCKGPFKIMAPLLKLMGQVPAHNETDVPVTVKFQSQRDNKSFAFNRTFHFREAAPYIFYSRMMQIEDNEVIEIMRFGLGWKMLYAWDGEKVVLSHRGYALQAFGHFIPVPLTLLLGCGYAEEIPVDDDTFDMVTHITHPLWGKIYEYKGRFTMTKAA